MRFARFSQQIFSIEHSLIYRSKGSIMCSLSGKNWNFESVTWISPAVVQAVGLRHLRTKNCFEPRLFYVTLEADKVAATEGFLRVLRCPSASIISPVPSTHLNIFICMRHSAGHTDKTSELKEKQKSSRDQGVLAHKYFHFCLHRVKKFCNIKTPMFFSDIFQPVLHWSSPSLHSHILAFVPTLLWLK
jgi:hypothetical protein